MREITETREITEIEDKLHNTLLVFDEKRSVKNSPVSTEIKSLGDVAIKAFNEMMDLYDKRQENWATNMQELKAEIHRLRGLVTIQ